MAVLVIAVLYRARIYVYIVYCLVYNYFSLSFHLSRYLLEYARSVCTAILRTFLPRLPAHLLKIAWILFAVVLSFACHVPMVWVRTYVLSWLWVAFAFLCLPNLQLCCFLYCLLVRCARIRARG